MHVYMITITFLTTFSIFLNGKKIESAFEEKDKASTPEIMLMRWGIWIVVLAVIVWGIHYGINSLI